MSIKASIGWMAIAQALSFALQFASTVVLARYLTPYEMGVSAVAFAVVGVVSVFQQLGLPSLIVREEVLTKELSSTAFTVNAVVSGLLSAIIVGVGYAGAAFLRDANVQHVVLVLAVSPLFGIFAFLPASNLERHGSFKSLALIGMLSGMIGAVSTIILATAHFSYMSVAYGQVAGSASLAILAAIVGRRHLSCRLSFIAWRRVAAFGFQMLAISGINSISSRLSEIVMARLLGLSVLGLFNRANGINALVWNNIHLAVGRVLLVDFAELHRRNVSLRHRYLRTVAIVTATLWPAFAGLAVVARPFVVLVYGERWTPIIPPFILLALSSMILVAVTMTWELFTATGKLNLQMRFESVKALFGLIVFTAGCLLSLKAAAAARLVEAVFAFVMYRPYVNRMTDTSNADYWPIYAQSLFATGCAIAPAAVAMRFGGIAGPSMLVLGMSILLGVAMWLGALFAMKHPVAEEIGNAVANRSSAMMLR